MMSEKQIQNWITNNESEMKSLEADGDDRDWIAYEEIERENEILRSVLQS